MKEKNQKKMTKRHHKVADTLHKQGSTDVQNSTALYHQINANYSSKMVSKHSIGINKKCYVTKCWKG